MPHVLPHSRGATRRTLLAVAALGALQALALAIPHENLARRLLLDAGAPASAAFALLLCLRAALRASGASRWGWGLLGASLALSAIRRATWAIDDLVRGADDPLAGLSYGALLPALLLATAGVVTLVVGRGARHPAAVGVLLDGVAISGGLFLLAWPTLAPEHGGMFDGHTGPAVTGAFTALMLGTSAAIGWRRAQDSRDSALLALALGFGLTALSGFGGALAIVHARFDSAGWYAAGSTGGSLLLALAAALDDPRPRSFRLAARAERTVPILALFVGAAGARLTRDAPSQDIAIGVLLFLAATVVARQLLDVREHALLLRERDALAKEAAEERDALREAERIASMGSWTIDLPSGDIRWSDGLHTLLARDRTLGPFDRREGEALAAGRFLDEMREALPRILAGETYASGDERVTLPDGSTRWITLRAHALEAPTGPRVVGTVLDITTRKEAELRRDEALALTAATFQAIPACVGVLTEDGRIVRANADLDALRGSTQDPTPLAELAAPGHEERVNGFLVRTWRSGSASEEAQLRARGGAPAPYLLTSRAFTAGSERYAVLVGFDLTDRKRAEESLRRGERLAGLGTLVAGVAHEINNPLTYARGSVELLAMSARERGMPDVAGDAERALHGLDRIARIARLLRDVARPPASERRRIETGPLVEGVVSLAETRLGERTTIRTDLRARGAVLANAEELTGVLLDLAMNGLDAMKGRAGALTIRARDEEDDVAIEVVDEGRGIPPEEAPLIFTPFHTTKPEGTGLALSLARGIVESHGGTLTFESQPGIGTSFTIRLPRARETP